MRKAQHAGGEKNEGGEPSRGELFIPQDRGLWQMGRWTTDDRRRTTDEERRTKNERCGFAVLRRPSLVLGPSSDIEPEVDHVAVLDDVLASFQADMTRRASACHAPFGHQSGLRRHFGANEAALDIGVDLASRFIG